MFSEMTPYLAGKIAGQMNQPPKCPYDEDTQAAIEWRQGWKFGYSRYQAIDSRYRFGSP